MNIPGGKVSFLARLLMMLLMLISTNRAQGDGSPDPGLKLHFDFDEDFSGGRVIDVSGNSNDGLQFNPTNWITATNGVFGTHAAYFTRVGVMTNDPPQVYPLTQYIAVTNLNGIEYLTNGTISLWARFDATNNGHNEIALVDCGYPAVYSWSPSQASNSWTWAKLPYQNYLSFLVYPDWPAGGAWILLTWPDDTVGGDNEATTNIHLYSLTFDCTRNRAVAFYDGQPYMTNALNVPWLKTYGTMSGYSYWMNWLCIGAASHDGTPQWGDDRYPNGGYFTGKMDDVRIYNRTLSASEIQALYYGYGSKAWNLPLAVTRISAESVEIGFGTVPGVYFQVEQRADLTVGTWLPLGAPILGTGARNTVVDSLTGHTTVFYRVRPLP